MFRYVLVNTLHKGDKFCLLLLLLLLLVVVVVVIVVVVVVNKNKGKFTLEQSTTSQRGSKGLAVLFL